MSCPSERSADAHRLSVGTPPIRYINQLATQKVIGLAHPPRQPNDLLSYDNATEGSTALDQWKTSK